MIAVDQKHFPEKKRIICKQLYDDKHWKEYNDHAEKVVQETVAERFGLQVGLRTVGYSPEYDYMLSGRKVEQKISVKEGLELEFERFDGRPSGISLTESDYYLTVSPCFSKWGDTWVKIGKVRLYKTKDLIKIFGKYESNTQYLKEYKPTSNSPGSRCLSFSEKDLKHIKGTMGASRDQLNIALLEVDLVKSGPAIVGYDFNGDKVQYCGNSEGWLKRYVSTLFK